MSKGGGTVTRVVAEIVRNRALTRLLLAYLVLSIAEFGEWLSLIIYAYARGGASAAGLVAIVQLIPSMLLAPAITARLSRIGAGRLLTLAYLAAAAALACCAAAILGGASVVLVYGTAVIFSLSLSVVRAVNPVLLPLVVRHPDELTAANVGASWCEGIGTLTGPVLVGALVSVDGPGLACAALAGLLIATPLLTSVHLLRAAQDQPGHAGDEGTGVLAELLSAARVIASRPSTRALIAFPAGSAVIEGAVDLLVVVLAVHVLALGSAAAGYLSAAFGLGGLVGGLAAIGLVGRRLAAPLVAVALLGALALAALALASSLLTVVLLLALVGGARAVQAISAQTLLQRSTPLEVVVCVFSLVEAIRDAGLTIGAALVPLFIGLGGVRTPFVALACLVPLLLLLTARRVGQIDSEASIPVVEIGVLRKLDIFRALPAASLETLARESRYASFPPETAIVTEGDSGEDYYAITHGSVRVTKGDRELGRLGVGEGFGEIALLHAVTRTATVRAAQETTVLGIARDPFLTAMHAHPASRADAERIAAELLGQAR
ncbi:MAG TPA: cyclic nucleotide-binding domain-containing protein [Solirubrobacteraceae bacterium]|jgi:hypothetical protein|nr:cyclic nucleotide-binding domain-containing protein [Solirubrobacteraceae bacterium]